ncbi:hypothetical protein DFP72DRAFT_42641 [Ephemerocybe angulata]|uniref:Uncharacterized protein n=1 Tax=Ephemerocybe angulata TaxID=980116 RepID=A0A8H6HES1_9AGAR|nr:hypothetical protein DFP72DRAFT_42641 [Tulosesus angulatus]
MAFSRATFRFIISHSLAALNLLSCFHFPYRFCFSVPRSRYIIAFVNLHVTCFQSFLTRNRYSCGPAQICARLLLLAATGLQELLRRTHLQPLRRRRRCSWCNGQVPRMSTSRHRVID